MGDQAELKLAIDIDQISGLYLQCDRELLSDSGLQNHQKFGNIGPEHNVSHVFLLSWV
jgi:hypothetical protein